MRGLRCAMQSGRRIAEPTLGVGSLVVAGPRGAQLEVFVLSRREIHGCKGFAVVEVASTSTGELL